MDFPPAIRALHEYQQYMLVNETNSVPAKEIKEYINQSTPFNVKEDVLSRRVVNSIHFAFQKINIQNAAYGYKNFLKNANPIILLFIYSKGSPLHENRFSILYYTMCANQYNRKISVYLACSFTATYEIPTLKLHPDLIKDWQHQNTMFQETNDQWGKIYMRVLALSTKNKDGTTDTSNALRIIYKQCTKGYDTIDIFKQYLTTYHRMSKNTEDKEMKDEWQHYDVMADFLASFCRLYTDVNSEGNFHNLIFQTALHIRLIDEQVTDAHDALKDPNKPPVQVQVDQRLFNFMNNLDWELLDFESDPCVAIIHESYFTDEFRQHYLQLVEEENASVLDKKFCILFMRGLDVSGYANEKRLRCLRKLQKIKVKTTTWMQAVLENGL